jgi:uncharacterized membrane protein
MSLVIKGRLAAGENVSGLGLLLTPHGLILNFWTWLTQNDLAEALTDTMAMWFRSLAEAFTLQSQYFNALYLLGHGILKFTMVIILSRRILWAYPAAMVVLAGFVVYQSFELVAHGSLILLMLALFDAIMIVMVFREWNMLKFRMHAAA